MNPILAHTLLLLVLLGIAKIVSALIKRPINGAFGYLVVAAPLCVIQVLKVFDPAQVPVAQRYEVLGELVGTLFIPLGLAFWLALRFEKKRRLAPEQADSEG